MTDMTFEGVQEFLLERIGAVWSSPEFTGHFVEAAVMVLPTNASKSARVMAEMWGDHLGFNDRTRKMTWDGQEMSDKDELHMQGALYDGYALMLLSIARTMTDDEMDYDRFKRFKNHATKIGNMSTFDTARRELRDYLARR